MALVCEGTGMDEEGASTLYLSDFGGELGIAPLNVEIGEAALLALSR
jgi:hypothetical protein